MLSVADARKMILSEVMPMPAQARSLAEANDCVVSADVTARIALPAWDNSAMDGYAVRAADIAAASENNPIHLRVAGELPAGAAAPRMNPEPTPGPSQEGNSPPHEGLGVGAVSPSSLSAQSCIRIFTGAPIPAGADAVVMQEDTRPHHAGYIAVVEAVEAGENIRRKGDDVALGAVVLRAGTMLGPAQAAMAAAVGLSQVTVHPAPRIGVLVTGAEVVEPGQPLGPGQIYDSNSTLLTGLVRRAGGIPVELGIADDTRDALHEKLDYGLAECDAVITVGGVSVGEYDLVKDVLLELGCQQKFWQVAMKPGKPFVFARRENKVVFGLPGNPVSAAVTFLVLVRPALLRMRGLTDLELPTVDAVAGADFVNHGERVQFMRARYAEGGAGRTVVPLPRQASHVISSLTEADCLVEVPACRTIAQGTMVKAIEW